MLQVVDHLLPFLTVAGMECLNISFWWRIVIELGIFFFFRYRCQIDTVKMVPVPRPILIKHFFYQLIIGLAISTKHTGPVSQTQTGLRLTLDYTSLYTKYDYSLFLYLSLLPLLACTYLNNAWDLVLRALPLSVCLVKINRFMYSPN